MALHLSFLIHKTKIIFSLLLTIVESDIRHENALHKAPKHIMTLLFHIAGECIFEGVYIFICTHFILLRYLCFTTLSLKLSDFF